MFTGLYTTTAGMLAQMKNLDIISNNLANINSPGFKKDKAIFRTFYDTAINASAAPVNSNGATLQNKDSNSMVVIERTISDFSDGVIKETGNPLDLAIQGDGFFQVQTPNGELYYSRGGAFQLNEAGEIVTQDGFKLMGELGPIVIEDGSGAVESKGIAFDESGILQINGDEIGRLRITKFVDNNQLEKAGHNSFINKDDKNFSTEPFSGKIQQQHLELSNVNSVEEMVEMINASRAFESYQKVVQAIMEDTADKAINVVGRKR